MKDRYASALFPIISKIFSDQPIYIARSTMIRQFGQTLVGKEKAIHQGKMCPTVRNHVTKFGTATWDPLPLTPGTSLICDMNS